MDAVYVLNPSDGYHLFCSLEPIDALKKTSSLSVSTVTNKKADPVVENSLTPLNKERTKSKRGLFRSLSNLRQSLSKTKLSKYKDLLKIRKRSQSPSISSTVNQSPKSANKNQQNRSADPSHHCKFTKKQNLISFFINGYPSFQQEILKNPMKKSRNKRGIHQSISMRRSNFLYRNLIHKHILSIQKKVHLQLHMLFHRSKQFQLKEHMLSILTQANLLLRQYANRSVIIVNIVINILTRVIMKNKQLMRIVL